MERKEHICFHCLTVLMSFFLGLTESVVTFSWGLQLHTANLIVGKYSMEHS